MTNFRSDGFMRPPKNLSAPDMYYAEKFAAAVGIGPLFNNMPAHHGQHSWCCKDCNGFRAKQSEKVRHARQPWEIEPESVPLKPKLVAVSEHGGNDEWFYQRNLNWVYFIQAVDKPESPIKIGFAGSPGDRLRGIQTGHPYKLQIVHCVPGDRKLERALHVIFKDGKSFGEWFAGASVPVILMLADMLCEQMRKAYKGGWEMPPQPSYNDLYHLAEEARQELQRRQGAPIAA